VRLAKKQNRTMSELMREALRVYETEELNRAESFRRMGELVASIQEDSKRNGTDKLTMDEINQEIAAVRRERSRIAKSA
jgi:hypothetical protein